MSEVKEFWCMVSGLLWVHHATVDTTQRIAEQSRSRFLFELCIFNDPPFYSCKIIEPGLIVLHSFPKSVCKEVFYAKGLDREFQ